MKLKTGRAIALLSGAMLAVAGYGPANAVQMCATCIPFTFNYSVGGTAYTAGPSTGPQFKPLGQINFTDPGLVVQQFNLLGQPIGNFTDTGAFRLSDATTDFTSSQGGTLGGPIAPLPGTSGSSQVFLYYALTGSTNALGQITFNPGGIIQLYSETNYTSTLPAVGNNIPQPDGGPSLTTLAEFDLVTGTSTINPAIGLNNFTVGSFGFEFKQVAGDPNTFVNFLTGLPTFIGGVANALLKGSANVSQNTVAFHSCDPGELGSVTVATSSGAQSFNTDPGGFVLCSETSAQGNFELSAAVPEPGTLALFGTGLLALGFGMRRRKARVV